MLMADYTFLTHHQTVLTLKDPERKAPFKMSQEKTCFLSFPKQISICHLQMLLICASQKFCCFAMREYFQENATEKEVI